MAGRIEGKVAVVTGAASGIGRATALRFAARLLRAMGRRQVSREDLVGAREQREIELQPGGPGRLGHGWRAQRVAHADHDISEVETREMEAIVRRVPSSLK